MSREGIEEIKEEEEEELFMTSSELVRHINMSPEDGSYNEKGLRTALKGTA